MSKSSCPFWWSKYTMKFGQDSLDIQSIGYDVSIALNSTKKNKSFAKTFKRQMNGSICCLPRYKLENIRFGRLLQLEFAHFRQYSRVHELFPGKYAQTTFQIKDLSSFNAGLDKQSDFASIVLVICIGLKYETWDSFKENKVPQRHIYSSNGLVCNQ